MNQMDMLRNMYGLSDFLCKSLLKPTAKLNKGLGKDNISNMLRLEDKPWTSLGHCKDIVRTTKRTTEDKPRVAPTESTT